MGPFDSTQCVVIPSGSGQGGRIPVPIHWSQCTGQGNTEIKITQVLDQ